METQMYLAQASGAKLVILENECIRICELDARAEWKIGRFDPSLPNRPDILFDSCIVSREHGWLRNIDGQWYYVDNPKNKNGTFYNSRKIPHSGKKNPVALVDGDILRIDNEDLDYIDNDGVLMLFTTAAIKGTWTVFPLENAVTIIGRNENCDLVIPLPYVSGKHTRIICSDGTYYLSDCKSGPGTFLNGHRVEKRETLRERDCIAICDILLFFLGDKLLYTKRNGAREQQELRKTRPEHRPVILSAAIQSKKVNISRVPFVRKEKELLCDVEIDIREGTLVAVLGTAGAGKSTLMGCLSGLDQKGVQGTVIYRGVDLLKNLEQMKYLIGNVPQEKVIHPELTPEEDFLRSARLRLSADTSKEEIAKRVENTLELLSMTKARNTRNSQLSGGEQTRVNVGIDLVADRDIYFLDEPEQGLSPNLRDELYVFLRNLAHNHGKTIIAIIHDVSCIDMFDQVIFLVKAAGTGRLAFSGSPEEGSRCFGVPIEKAYALLEANPEKYVR